MWPMECQLSHWRQYSGFDTLLLAIRSPRPIVFAQARALSWILASTHESAILSVKMSKTYSFQISRVRCWILTVGINSNLDILHLLSGYHNYNYYLKIHLPKLWQPPKHIWTTFTSSVVASLGLHILYACIYILVYPGCTSKIYMYVSQDAWNDNFRSSHRLLHAS